jgi:hypothetical protein
MSCAVALADDVVVLYADPRGPYPGLVRDWYGEERNAMTYRGSLPVVAHPPCGPWGPRRPGHNHAEEIALAPHAVAIVQRCGGVLEHPAGSTLFEACGLPRPGDPFDSFFGRTIEVSQCDWGHPARKRTWLYIVGRVGPHFELPPMPAAREPTHWASGGRTRSSRRGSPVPPGIKVCSAQQRRRTPPAFAAWLIEVARRCVGSQYGSEPGRETKR